MNSREYHRLIHSVEDGIQDCNQTKGRLKMRIDNVKINGIKNPVGFDYPRVKCSWKVTETKDKAQKKARIQCSLREDMLETIYILQGEHLASIGTVIELELMPYTRYYYTVEVWGDGGDYAISEVCYFETSKMETEWTADFIGTAEPEDTIHPSFYKEFVAAKKVTWARIYVTGLGLYEAYLNGEKIGNDLLAPFCNDYNQKVQYQTYDVTSDIEPQNQLEIITGNGWYKGRLGYDGDAAYYGNRFGTIAELHIRYEDGTKEIVKTDETWKYRGSNIIFSDIYDGETIDKTYWETRENQSKPVVKCDATSNWEFDKSKLTSRYSLPVVVKEELPVKEIIKTPAGETVLDMGQNFAGYLSFYADLPKGTTVVLDFGEIMQKGNFYNENYRTAKSRFTYVSDGTAEWVRPHFTYFGFRYVRVTGWSGELRTQDFKGQVVYSDLAPTTHFQCSNEKLERLYQNTLWGQKSNFLDMPTDCPQRDERLGWTGDAQVFSPTASFQMDTRAFYRKFLNDLRLEQQKLEGAIPNYLPNNSPMPGGSSVWGDVATFVPMTLYDYYGDKEELADYYPLMKDWVEFIIRGDKEHGEHHLWNFGFHFGDWLAQDGITPQSMKGGTDDHFVASVYYYASVKKLAEAAEIIGHPDDAKYYLEKADKIYQAILHEYYSPSGRLTIDTQTGYLLALNFGIYLDKIKIIDGFKVRLKKDCYKIKGGFVGATMMCQVMAEHGMEELASYILFQEGFPGWMHCIGLGATTIWERWNSVLDDGSISGTNMNSLNHYAYGSVMEYVYRYIAGISTTQPGFKKVRIAPQINSRLNKVRFSYDSISGTYVSAWTVHQDGTVTIHVEVPFGCSAAIVLPGTDGKMVNVNAGIYEETYMPNRNYRQKYQMTSRLEEMKDDVEAMKILEKDLPIAAGMIAGNDVESMSMSLEELKVMFFLGFNPQMVQTAAEQLLQLKN